MTQHNATIDWNTASLEEVSAHLDVQAERQRATFPETAAAYAAEQHAPDPQDELEDMG